jgi:Bacterial TSP3 repeat
VLVAVASTVIPALPASAAVRDTDHDGLSNRHELKRSHTNPRRADTDRDRLRDGFELRRSRTNPRRRDTDGDGLGDGFEWRRSKTSPRRKDTDGDGSSDGMEVYLGTDPRRRHHLVVPAPVTGAPSAAPSSPTLDATPSGGSTAPGPSPGGSPEPSPPPPPPGTLGLRQVDGGPDFHGRYSNAFPGDASFFPIGVFFESVTSQADVDKDKGAGLNTYVRLTGNSNLGLVRSNGMHAIAQPGNAGVGSETKGWLTEDEPDMWAGPGSDAWTGSWTGAVCSPPVTQGGRCGYTVMETINGRLPADGRARYTNYGKGVIFWQSNAQAARFLNGTAAFGPYQDIVSSDIYFFTDNHSCIASQGGRLVGVNRDLNQDECHRAYNYGLVIDRQRALIVPHGSRPVWAFVELGHPFSESHWPSITPAQVRAAVWHSLIAGARGVIYFNHSFGGPCITHHALREPCYAQIRAAVTATNTQIKTLAPVLNAPFVDGLLSTSNTVRAMAKWSGGSFYVFAGSAGSATTAAFSMPCVGNATATVLDEGRTVPITDGSFTDSFADANAVHIYRIDGGSKCGLTP